MGCVVLSLGLTLSEARRGRPGKGGRGGRFWGKLTDTCKNSLRTAKDGLSCADGSRPFMVKGKASAVNVGDEITRPERPTTRPCSAAADGATETLGTNCFLCASKGRPKTVTSKTGATDFTFTFLLTNTSTFFENPK